MLSPIRWAVVALLTSAAVPALADHTGVPHDESGQPCTFEGYDAVRMQAAENACAAGSTRGGTYDATTMMAASDARDEGGGAGEPQAAQEQAPDAFQARIWTGP